MEEALLSASQVAERFGFSKQTLYLRIRQGEFPKPLAIGGKDIHGRKRMARWPKSQVDQIITETIEKSET
jgi:predicted DNA-binding transcriptional regulator AlpA